jgi:hypothetical protein
VDEVLRATLLELRDRGPFDDRQAEIRAWSRRVGWLED